MYFPHLAFRGADAVLQMSQKVVKIERVNIEDLALDFTIPGYDIELRVSATVFYPQNTT